ncbi:MAG: SDR family NAD(P)-dependent oxidoreductase [Acidimicrobiaceae bacterium]|nr:SDR family NAD(P)-dependent oxidoreductase [Acidimicrobiaceae bacterium]MDE0163438.1 SDR family NAD(P)-dependent oxidoreductase [Acidimicrobiaceae bacterium]
MAEGLRGRRCLVTGAAAGIGRRIAARLASEGMQATLLDIDPAVEDVARSMSASSIVADLADVSETRGVLAEDGRHGPYWLVVNNAGVFSKTPLLETTLEEWDRVQRVNARSMVVVMQELVPAMISAGAGGRVVNVASMAAKLGTPGEAAYAASKAAVVALSRIAAMEFGPHGVTVNAVCPGYVLTEMGAAARTGEQVAAWTAKSPLGRLGDPGDVASAVAFLASDDGSYMTGQAINVTGGMCMW